MDILFLIHIIALLFSFFVIGAVLGAVFSEIFRHKIVVVVRRLLLNKSDSNPILKPGTNVWAAEAVMNPAAAFFDGRTHLIYRAIGSDGVSRLGYASSADGIVFDKQLPYPAFVATRLHRSHMHNIERRYSLTLYPSGGSWGGCEDPRMVMIDGRVYVTINIFDGWNFIRVAFISIAEDDFLAEQFDKWEGPHLISPPGQIHKNWVLFPEKIGGRFAILHSITPNVEIAFLDDIENVGITEPFVESWVGARDCLPARDDSWDSFVRGAGPPPIRTDRGWLLFYHAIDNRDPGRYKLGAMLLDLADPTKVLYRAAAPVISPDEYYENDGKPGIVYACGAVVRTSTELGTGDKKLFVYYGGADKVVCVATSPLNHFLDALVEGSQASLTAVPAQIV
ncbi:MAG: hypothetical protein NTU85_01570 [Candidatus Kaiserbacteria bacterium]|nr:hypothetical protein [Candidatus Kaiserbacteria bacterium]